MNGARPLRRLSVVLIAGAATLVSAETALAAAPVNTAPPTITGTAAVGDTLTVHNGTWRNSPTSFEYRWLRCNASGGSCVGIPAATEKTYKVVGADVGHRLRVRVTAINADGSTNAQSAPTAVVQQPSGAPKNTVRPTISGTARAGQTLTATNGSWSGNPTSFAYQWQRCDADGSHCGGIAGSTSQTYTVQAADVGFRLRVAVTAKNAQGGTSTATSGVTAIVQPAAPITNRRPTLRIISIGFRGASVYARIRICDDSDTNLTIIETDSHLGVRSQTRRFSTLVPPLPCGVYTRHWVPARRFRVHGRYTITLRARDRSRLTSAPARRTFRR